MTIGSYLHKIQVVIIKTLMTDWCKMIISALIIIFFLFFFGV